MMEYVDRITGLIKSFCTLFYVGTADHQLAVRKCLEIASGLSVEVYGYNIAEGLWRPGQEKPRNSEIDPMEMLNRILNSKGESFTGKRKLFLLEHFDLLLENRDPFLLTRLRRIADSACIHSTVVLTGRAGFTLPETLGDIPQVSARIPSHEEIGEIVDTCKKNLTHLKKGEIVEALAGLTTLQCEDLLALSLATGNEINPQFLGRQRAAIIAQRAKNLIQLCDPAGNLEDVGGLDLLKHWLMKRGRCFQRKPAPGSRPAPEPKGVLLAGPPGCGKSFLVQALAGSWGINLIRLDPPRLFRSLVGETEQNFLAAFETVRSLAPAVLWIDEFEKFFPRAPDQSADGGVLSRVLALFLDFLQSRRNGIFVCATTNAIAALPQEILRAGRFDAVFFIDLPNKRDRAHILEVLLKKHGLEGKIGVTEEVLHATESFSGAELEQGVTEILYEQEKNEMAFNQFTFLKTIRTIVPLARTMAENMSAMREWYRTRARSAASLDHEAHPGRRKICPISQK